VVQPDGGRLTDATLLHPGWTLLLPADAATTQMTAVVHAGDTLGKIANGRLHDPRRAQEIFELNEGRPQPNGSRLTDPDQIQPGWRLTLPATPAPTDRPHPEPQPTDDRPPFPTGAEHPPTGTTPPTADPTTTQPPPTPPPTTNPPTTTPPPGSLPSSPVATPSADPAPVSAPVGTVAEWGVSALVVSGLVAALTMGRRRQQRRRGYRRRIAVPDDPAGRREWHAVTTPSALDTARLDAALRGLALQDWPNDTTPDLTRVVLTADKAALHLADQTTVAPPFVQGEDAATWLLPVDADLPLHPDEAGRYCAPYPLLVSVAADDDQLLLLDLEHLGYATVTGERDMAVGLLRHIAAELANARWSDDVEILLVGFGVELLPLNTDRLRVLPDLAAALTELRVARRRIAATREATGVGVVEGRLSGTAPDGWLPVLLLIADLTGTDEAARAELHALGDEPLERGFAVLAHDTDVVGAEIRITDEGTLHSTGVWPDTGLGRWRVETMTAAVAGGLADILAPINAADLPAGPAEHPEPWAADMDSDGALTHSDDPPPGDDASTDDASPDDASSDDASTDDASTDDASTDDASSEDSEEPASPEALRRLEIVEHQDPDLDDDLATWHLAAPPRPLVGVLGEPSVRAPGERPRTRAAWFTEILVYLALHPAGVSQDKALTDLWPDGHQVAVGTVRTSLYGARRWAGRGLGGDPDRSFISDLNHDQTYRLRGHLLDFDLFRRLRKRAQARHAAHHPGAVADYQAALRLVRGPVLSGLRPAGYAWLNNHDQRHDLQIPGYLVDTAHELVDIALTNRDIELARWAAETARSLDVDGIFDRPLTDLMRVAHASGHTSQMERYARILLDAREADIIEDLPPETFTVLDRLMPAGPRPARRPPPQSPPPPP
jgi:hypothetical protein